MSRYTRSSLRLTLRPGNVFYFQDRNLTSRLAHYFIVINNNPYTDEFLILTVASSKINACKSRRKKFPKCTLVEVDPQEYQVFSKKSIIDCNNIFRRSLDELLEKLNTNQVKEQNDIPGFILERLQAGVRQSTLVEEEVKRLLG